MAPRRLKAGMLHGCTGQGILDREASEDTMGINDPMAAPVRAVHPGGFVRTKGVCPEQRVVCQRGLFRLIVVIEYGHVTPNSRIGTEWQPTPDGDLGRLCGRDSWRCLDPDFSKQMPDKGNHIHLMTEGINAFAKSDRSGVNREAGGTGETCAGLEGSRNSAVHHSARP